MKHFSVQLRKLSYKSHFVLFVGQTVPIGMTKVCQEAQIHPNDVESIKLLTDYWTSLCILLCMFALAESNIYASIRPDYYRLFNYCSEPDTWRTDSIKFSWKILLFFFNYMSIGKIHVLSENKFRDALLV